MVDDLRLVQTGKANATFSARESYSLDNREVVKVKIGSDTVFSERPGSGKEWQVSIKIDIVETKD